MNLSIGADLPHKLPEIIVPVQVHVVAMFVRIGCVAVPMGAKLAAEKIVLLI